MSTKKMYVLLFALVFGVGSVVGCPTAGDDDDDASGDFEAGLFLFSTVAVDDGCINGAAEALYMPDGPGVPVVWEEAIELPSFDELPKTYSIPLPDPFHDMQVTITSPGTDQLAFEGGDNLDVLLDEDVYGDCLVDNDIAALITVHDADNVVGSATLTTTNVRGDNCPQFEADPCDVVLEIEAVRQ